MKKITEEWLKAAKDDLDVINHIVTYEHLTNIVAFHSQQCIEKSLKAITEEFEIGTFRIHNLQRLFEITKDYVKIEADIFLIEKLDKLYTESRYPGELGLLPYGKPTIQDAQELYDFAKNVWETIKTKIKELSEDNSGENQ